MEQSGSIWQGAKVRLRALEPEDWSTYDAWNRDDDQARRLYFVPFPQSQAATKQWAEQTALKRPDDDQFRFVIESRAGEAVGNIDTHGCDRRMGTFSYELNVRDGHRRQGYASEAIALVLRYYFHELRYQKVTVHVYDFNEPSIVLHERLGFQREGHLRRMLYGNGRFSDVLVYGLLSEEFGELAKHLLVNSGG